MTNNTPSSTVNFSFSHPFQSIKKQGEECAMGQGQKLPLGE